MTASKTSSEPFFAWNGELRARSEGLSVDPLSDGWLYGLGCFETMALEGGKIRFERDHRTRLEKALAELGLGSPVSWEEAVAALARVAEANACREGVGRLSFHAAPGGTVWMARAFPGGRFAEEGPLDVGRSRFPHPGPSPLSRWKHNNYALNLLAFREALEAGRRETLLVRGDRCVEGALSTLWTVRGGECATPPLEDGALPGVVRGRLLEAGSAAGLDFRERSISLADLETAEAVFFSNAVMLVRPVVRIDGREYPARSETAAKINRFLRSGAAPGESAPSP